MTAPGPQPARQPGQPPSATPPADRRVGGPAPAQKPKRNVSVGQILGGLLFVLVIIFIVENTEEVAIRFIAGPKVRLPVYVALLIAAVVGALIAALLRYRRQRHHSPK